MKKPAPSGFPQGTSFLREGEKPFERRLMRQPSGIHKVHDPRFGTVVITLEPISGEATDAVRNGTRTGGWAIHGGGSRLGNRAFDPEQELTPTQGCVRQYNRDMRSILEATRALEAAGDQMNECVIREEHEFVDEMSWEGVEPR